MPKSQNSAILQHNYTKALRRYAMMTLILVIAGGYYFFTQYQKLASARQATLQGQETLATLEQSVKSSSNQYTDFKKDFDQRFSLVYSDLSAVYPDGERGTDLARLFEKFEQDHNTTANPIVLSDLKFSSTRVDAGKEYAVLPLSLTLSGTQDNFLEFLKFIENSGRLEDKTRMMDVRSISVNFVSPQLTKPLWNVTIALNAYFQKPLVPKVSRTGDNS